MSKFFGKVISGRGLGRQFGFPTLNLVFVENPALEYGVHACYAAVPDSMRSGQISSAKIAPDKFPALLHFGPRPTIGDENPSFEVFFLKFPEGQNFEELEVEVLGKIRDVMQFNSLEELAAQIQQDREKAVVEYFHDFLAS